MGSEFILQKVGHQAVAVDNLKGFPNCGSLGVLNT